MDRSKRTFTLGTLATIGLLPVSSFKASADGQKTHVVEIVGAAFQPETLRLTAGDSVTWVNHDIVPHTATALDDSWDSGVLKNGEQYTRTFASPATAEYFCRLHPAMRATLSF